MNRRKARLIGFVLTVAMALGLIAGCGAKPAPAPSTEAPKQAAGAKKFEGTTITVLLPPWGTLPAEVLAKFTTETGIKVNMQTMGWDEIHDKIVAAAAANTAPADVTEFDWSWVGQFGAANWYVPLNDYIDKATQEDTLTLPIFTYNGKILAMPYTNDFRVTIINKQYFDQAGITQLPNTLEELTKAAQTLKEKKVVEYPIGLPLSATEGAATPWYMLTKALGGELFDANWNSQFTKPDSPGYKAFEWIITTHKAQLADPAAIAMSDVDTIEAFGAGKYAVDLAGWPGNLAVYNDPSKSKIAGQAQPIPVPGAGGKHISFGLPEGLGIPAASKNKEAAAEFIKWWAKSENVKEFYSLIGVMPNRMSVLEALNKEGKLIGGDVLLKQLAEVKPLFPQGTPKWYPQFSTNVATVLNQAAKGELTTQQAVDKLAAVVKDIAK